jgi:hypothetical protein
VTGGFGQSLGPTLGLASQARDLLALSRHWDNALQGRLQRGVPNLRRDRESPPEPSVNSWPWSQLRRMQSSCPPISPAPDKTGSDLTQCLALR